MLISLKKWYSGKKMWIAVDKKIEISTGYPQRNNVMK